MKRVFVMNLPCFNLTVRPESLADREQERGDFFYSGSMSGAQSVRAPILTLEIRRDPNVLSRGHSLKSERLQLASSDTVENIELLTP